MVKAFGDASYVVAALVVVALAFVIYHRFRAVRAEQAARAGRDGVEPDASPGTTDTQKQPADRS
jgi:hypothetical protein